MHILNIFTPIKLYICIFFFFFLFMWMWYAIHIPQITFYAAYLHKNKRYWLWFYKPPYFSSKKPFVFLTISSKLKDLHSFFFPLFYCAKINVLNPKIFRERNENPFSAQRGYFNLSLFYCLTDYYNINKFLFGLIL